VVDRLQSQKLVNNYPDVDQECSQKRPNDSPSLQRCRSLRGRAHSLDTVLDAGSIADRLTEWRNQNCNLVMMV